MGSAVAGISVKTLRRVANAALAIAVGMAIVPILQSLPTLGRWFGKQHDKLASAANVFEALVVAVAAIIAYLAYRSAMRTVAKQNTLDRIFEDHSDREVVHQRRLFRAIKNSSDDKLENYSHSKHREAFVQRKAREARNNVPSTPKPNNGEVVLKPEERAQFEKDFDERQTAIFGVLNRYETFAVGISEKAIDPSLYKRWWRSQFVSDWHAARSTIEKMRVEHSSSKLFVEFEELAKRWEREPAASS